ncbi:hypothetical protein AB3N60_18585 [Leptospira sp. WS39.C2]
MTVSGHSHNHGWIRTGKGKLSTGFSFHPKLAEWLSIYTTIPKEADLEILEVSCGEVSCPTEETLIVWKDPSVIPPTSQPAEIETTSHINPNIESHTIEFRISRKKENISKMDVDLSWKRYIGKS